MNDTEYNLNMTLIEEELSRDGNRPSGHLWWLEESYRNPVAFWQSLKASQNIFFPLAGKSIPLKQYDFFHDCITRHLRLSAPAFRWHDSILGWQEMSYSQLGETAERQAAIWREMGVRPGQLLCIIYPLGVKYGVSLLAALKIGLTLSFLPPQGAGLLQRRLEVLNPDYIITDEIYSSFFLNWRDRLLPEDGSAEKTAVPERSYTYPSGDVIALCFDPVSETPLIPRELTSDAAYLCPLRDGMIALGLRPGQVIAAPGFHFFEAYPALVLAALLNGCTYLHLVPDDIAENPHLLTMEPIRAIGICSQVRDILLQKPVEVGKLWSYWFKNPAESADLDQWQSFIRILKLEEVLPGNLKWETALGGSSLFSLRRKGQAHLNVLPSAGIPWCLTDLSGSGLDVMGDSGLFSMTMMGEKEEKKTIRPSILSKNGKEWLFVGSQLSGRAGRYYPRIQILESIQGLPLCSSCSIVEIPIAGTAGNPLFVLLIFTGGKSDVDEAHISKEIRKKIENEMGREFLPDRIQFFPLFPRCDPDGTIDHEWCQRQYILGSLSRKSRDELYQCLARLRQGIQLDRITG